MMKRIIALILILNVSACAELQQVVNQFPQGGLGNDEIASGLRQALNFGIDKQVSKLTAEDGFFKNELVKILLPEELQKVDGIGPSTYKKISKDITVTNKLKEVPSKGRISSSIEYE